MTLPGFRFEPRIVFAAVVAFTDKPTKDGRTLATPDYFDAPMKSCPIPVMRINRKGTKQVGVIEKAYVVDRRLIVFGQMDTTPEGREAVDMLERGMRSFEVDVTTDHLYYDLDPATDPIGSNPGPLTFKVWKVHSVWVGDSPCWDLPKAQIQELNR